MKLMNGRLVIAVGVGLALVGLLAFSLSSPAVTLGADTDVELPADAGPDADADVGAGADPPASLPETGVAGPEASGSTNVLLVSMLAALGVTMAGAGLIAVRLRRQGQEV